MENCDRIKQDYNHCIQNKDIFECTELKITYLKCLRQFLTQYYGSINYNRLFNLLSNYVVDMNFPLTIQKVRGDLFGTRLFTKIDFHIINDMYSKLNISDDKGAIYKLQPLINPQLYWLSSNTSNRVGADIFFPVNNNRIQLRENRMTGTSKGWVCKNTTKGDWYKSVLNKILPIYKENFKNYFFQVHQDIFKKSEVDSITCEIEEQVNELNNFKFIIENIDSRYIKDIFNLIFINNPILHKPDILITLENGDTFKLINSIIEFGRHIEYNITEIYYNNKIIQDKEDFVNIKFFYGESDKAYDNSDKNNIIIFINNFSKVNIDFLYPFPTYSYLSFIQEDYKDQIYLENIPTELEILYKIIFMNDTYTNFQIGIQLQHNNFLANKVLKQEFIKNIDILEEKFSTSLLQINQIKELYSKNIDLFLKSLISENLNYNDIINDIFQELYVSQNVYKITNSKDMNGIYLNLRNKSDGSFIRLLPASRDICQIEYIKAYNDASEYLQTIINQTYDSLQQRLEDTAEKAEDGVDTRYVVNLKDIEQPPTDKELDELPLVEKEQVLAAVYAEEGVSKSLADCRAIIEKRPDMTFKKILDLFTKKYGKKLDEIIILWRLSQLANTTGVPYNPNSQPHPGRKLLLSRSLILFLEKSPTNHKNLDNYFTNLGERIRKRYDDIFIKELKDKISMVSQEELLKKNGGHWVLKKNSIIFAYQPIQSSPELNYDKITTERWYLAPEGSNWKLKLPQHIESTQDSGISISQDLLVDEQILLIINHIIKNIGEESCRILDNLPDCFNIHRTLLEEIEYHKILDFFKNNLAISDESELTKENILKIFHFYNYLYIITHKLDLNFNQDYIRERKSDFTSQRNFIMHNLYSDIDILRLHKQREDSENYINPFRYKVDMKHGDVEISDSNWWMNTNSNTINYIKTFFLNHGLDNTTNDFFELSRQLPLINFNKSVSISYEFKSSSREYGVISPIYKNLNMDTDEIYYNQATLCDDPISPNLSWNE